VANDFSLIELRIARSLITKKSVQFISEVLNRPYEQTLDLIRNMSDSQKLIPFEKQLDNNKLKVKLKKKNQKRFDDQDRVEKKRRTAKQLYEQERDSKKRAGPQFKTRVINMSELVAVKIDHKTTVYVKPGTDIEATRKKYNKALHH